ncbi:MAG: hypothetical protein NVSMB34_01560 [Variovorax sp.]
MSSAVYAPEQLMQRYRTLRQEMSVEAFFRKPGLARLREMWCAAHFVGAVDQNLVASQVAIDEVDSQDDVDFELLAGGDRLPFQVAEVIEPGRRRSTEYKDFKPGATRLEDWSLGTQMGPSWIREAIEAKLQKNYSRTSALNLLLYLNFPAYEQQYLDIRSECWAVLGRFASVWLLNGNAFACLQPSPALPSVEGWMKIPEGLVDDEP